MPPLSTPSHVHRWSRFDTKFWLPCKAEREYHGMFRELYLCSVCRIEVCAACRKHMAGKDCIDPEHEARARELRRHSRNLDARSTDTVSNEIAKRIETLQNRPTRRFVNSRNACSAHFGVSYLFLKR